MSSVDDVVQRVSGGGFVVALFDLAKSDVVNDQQVRSCPGFESTWVRAVSESGMQVVEQVDAAGVAHADALFAGAQRKGFENVTLARAALAGDHQVVASAYEIEQRELEHEGLVEARLEVPVERFKSFSLDETARVDPS
jgi:hypothetical protein